MLDSAIIEVDGYALGAVQLPRAVRYAAGYTFVRTIGGATFLTQALLHGVYPIIRRLHPEMDGWAKIDDLFNCPDARDCDATGVDAYNYFIGGMRAAS
jgi:hypothetical protein